MEENIIPEIEILSKTCVHGEIDINQLILEGQAIDQCEQILFSEVVDSNSNDAQMGNSFQISAIDGTSYGGAKFELIKTRMI